MALDKRHGRWFLLLLLFIPVFLHKCGQRNDQIARTPVQTFHTPDRVAAVAGRRQIEERPHLILSPAVISAPTYFPASDSRFTEYKRPSKFLFMGRVLSDRSEPLPGAVISLHEWSPKPPDYQWPVSFISHICDAEGRFRISMESPASAWVWIRRDGFSSKEDFLDFSEQPTIVKSYRLFPAPSCVEGYVRDRKGIPIPGAVVLASIFRGFHSTALDAIGFCPPAGFTDSAGKYVIRELPEGPGISLRARVQKYLTPVSVAVNLKAGNCARADIQMEEALVFSLRVTNDRSQPISSAYAVPGGESGHVNARGDRSGTITFTVPIDINPFECLVRAPGYRAQSIHVDPKDPPVQVILEDGQVFTGRVINESGGPVPDTKIFVTVKNNLKREHAISDQAGHFSLKSGEVDITGFVAVKSEYLEQRVTLSDNRAIPSDIEIRLIRPQGGIFGRLLDDDGNPVKLFDVVLDPGPWMPSHFRSFENEQGLFSITDVPPGNYNLTFFSVPSARLERAKEIDIKGLEIKKGYYFGELLVRFPPARQNK